MAMPGYHAGGLSMNDLERAHFKAGILKLADKFEKEHDLELARAVRKDPDKVIDWYVEHQRVMTLPEFRQVLGLKAK